MYAYTGYMGRPRVTYRIDFLIKIRTFRPVGAPREGIVVLAPEEAEALRLKHLKCYDQSEAALFMGVSQSTFQRTLVSAHRKVAEALIEGKEIRIEEPRP
jgi:predicted DNA-binding protein (UPF0251 family)